MDQDQGAGIQHQRLFDHLTRVDRNMVDRAHRHERVFDDAVLAVEIEDVELLDRSANGHGAIVQNCLPTAQDGVLAEVAAQDFAGLKDDGFFLGGHGGLAELRTSKHPALSGGASGVLLERRKARPSRMQTVAVSGPTSADPVEELLGASFHIEAGVLLGLVARQSRDPLDKVEDTFGRAALFHQHLLDDLAGFRL